MKGFKPTDWTIEQLLSEIDRRIAEAKDNNIKRRLKVLYMDVYRMCQGKEFY